MGLAIALDQTRALRHLERQAGVPLRRIGDVPQPALDQLLLLAVAVAVRAPGLEPGERANQQEAEEARGLDVHADVVGVELAALFRPGDELFSKISWQKRRKFLDAGLEVV